MDNNALDKQRKSAQLASDFAHDHPTSEIKTVEDLHAFMRSSPGLVEEWINTRNDIPIEMRGVQALAESFQAASQLTEMSSATSSEPTQETHSGTNPVGLFLASVAGVLATRNNDFKLAQEALVAPAPEINLYDYVPEEIAQDKEYQKEIEVIKEAKIEDLKKKNPTKEFKDAELERYANTDLENTRMRALHEYVNTSERAEKVRLARDNAVYIKDASGNVIGERIYKDNKGKAAPQLDPVIQSYQRQKRAAIRRALERRESEIKRGGKPKHNVDDTIRLIDLEYDFHLATLFPEKAAAYSKTSPEIKRSLKVLQTAAQNLQKEENKKTPNTEVAEKDKRTVKGLLQKWNTQTFERAKRRGYNRFSLRDSLRDLKVWAGRRFTPRETGVLRSAENSFFSQGETHATSSERRQRSSQSVSPRQIARILQEENPSIAQWTSPRGIGTKVWNRFFTPRISNLNRSLGRQVGQQALQGAAKGAAKSAAQNAAGQIAKSAAANLAEEGATAVIANPPVLIAIGVILLIILFIILIVMIVLSIEGKGSGNFNGGLPPPPGSAPPPKNTNPIPDFTLTKSVSATEIPDASYEITYTISYSLGSGGTIKPEDITIYDTVPNNTTIDPAKTTGKYIYDSGNNTISWALSEPENSSLTSFSFAVTPNTTDVNISNSAWATANSSSVPPGSSLAPNSDTCGGKYFLSDQGNFGDPACVFTKDDLYTALKSQDPANADYWYLKIVPCESGYSPNAYLAASTSGLGAYGLFQMNPAGKGNGEFDGGNVNFPLQISNAINYNKLINGSFSYWGCK